MKRIMSPPLAGGGPGLGRAYDRLRRAIGGQSADLPPEETGDAPLDQLLPLNHVPVSLLELDSRLLLRFALEEEVTREAIDASFALASRFTRHGATIVDLQEREDGVYVEFLLTVEQAMFVLGHTTAAPLVLEKWLRAAGYTGSLRKRIDELAAVLRDRYAPEPTTPALPLPLAPSDLDESGWN